MGADAGAGASRLARFAAQQPAAPDGGVGAAAGASRLASWACAGLVMLFVQIGLGGWTSANYAGLACPDFPTCQGQWWPDGMDFRQGFAPRRGIGAGVGAGAGIEVGVDRREGALPAEEGDHQAAGAAGVDVGRQESSARQTGARSEGASSVDVGRQESSARQGDSLSPGGRTAIAVAHRIGALVTLLLLAGIACAGLRQSVPRLRRLAGIMLLLLLVQWALGIAIVLLRAPVVIANGHNAAAALLLLSLVALLHTAGRWGRVGRA